MVSLSQFRIDSKAIEEGAWVSPGDEYDDMEVYVRGYTDAYTDYRAARLRRAAVSFGGDTTKIPAQKSREIMVDAVIKHIVMDVRNLVNDGIPVTFPQFCDLLRNPDYADLVLAVLKAAASVGTAKAVELDETKKNSQKP